MVKSFHFYSAKSQSGAALLVFLLLMVTGASYVLINKLNANVTIYSRQENNNAALQEAKAALIAYALNYPEINPGEGVGFLPCPDTNNDGESDGACSLAGPTNWTVGRLPYNLNALGVSTLRDQAGEVLWYAVADNYRNNPKVPQMNSDVAGDFSVDGINDIVAIIFAPGPPVSTQNRTGGGLTDISNYLEDDNADMDNNFVTRSNTDFNDQLVYITREDLMTEVEKRILGEVEQALIAYQTTTGNLYPWLSTFTDPSMSDFRGAPGVSTRGHLPFHWAADPEAIINSGTIAGRNPFTTDYSFTWDSITNASTSQTSGSSAWFTLPAPTVNCAANMECTDGSDLFNGLTTATQSVSAASCDWSDQDTFGCPAVTYTDTRAYTAYSTADLFGYKNSDGGPGYDWFWTNTDGTWNWKIAYFNSFYPSAYDGICCWTAATYSIRREVRGNIEREYTVDISLTDPDGADINPPDSVTARTRDLDITTSTNPMTPASISVSVEDTYTITAQYPPYGMPANIVSTTTLTSDGDTNGNITISGLHYDLDIDGNELPEWFVENGWHELVYVAYATGEGSPPGTTVCTSGTNCITLNGTGGTNDNKRGVIVVAGQALSGQDRSTSPDILDYFENANSVVDDDFEVGTLTNFNDHVRVLAEAP